jgi:hypothetical protein
MRTRSSRLLVAWCRRARLTRDYGKLGRIAHGLGHAFARAVRWEALNISD